MGSRCGFFRRSSSQCLDSHKPLGKRRTSGKDFYYSKLSSDSPRGRGSFSQEPGIHLYRLGPGVRNLCQSTNHEEGLWSRICFDTEKPLSHDCRHLTLHSEMIRNYDSARLIPLTRPCRLKQRYFGLNAGGISCFSHIEWSR